MNISWVTHPLRSGIKFGLDEIDIALSIITLGKFVIKELCDLFIERVCVKLGDSFCI